MQTISVKRWFVHVCCERMANIWHHNRLRCAEIISITRRLAISRHKNDHQSHQTQRPCCRTWSRAILSMYCRWSSLAAGLIGCSAALLPLRYHSHWRYVSSPCCSEASNWHHLTPPGYRRHPGISWMCLDCAASTHSCWARTMVSVGHVWLGACETYARPSFFSGQLTDILYCIHYSCWSDISDARPNVRSCWRHATRPKSCLQSRMGGVGNHRIPKCIAKCRMRRFS